MAKWKSRNRRVHYAMGPFSFFSDLMLRWSPGRSFHVLQDFGETWAGLE